MLMSAIPSFNKYISVHHVGGRNGSRGFPVLNKFEKDIVNVLYDADSDCISQIEEKNRCLESRLHVLPYCLSDFCKKSYFNINYDLFSSSLLEPNQRYSDYYFFNDDHDYILSEALQVMEKRCVELTTIDHILQTDKNLIPHPDFLSLDTQGSEYEILYGARETLKTSVIALSVEVSFHPLYKGQKLFGELAQLLDSLGFDFIKFLNIGQCSPYRASIGLRAEGIQTYGDALFFKRVNCIDNMSNDIDNYFIKLRKLAFIAIVFNQFEYGLQCLDHVKEYRHLSVSATKLGDTAYNKFLDDLMEKIGKMRKIFPQTFTSKYTFTGSKDRFKSSVNKNKRGTKELLKKIPLSVPLVRFAKYVFRLCNEMVFFVKAKFFIKYSAVESVLINYGLRSQAKILYKNRIVQSRVRGKLHSIS